MSDELKVGDVCEVVDACCALARARIIGIEIHVDGLTPSSPTVLCTLCGSHMGAYVMVTNLSNMRRGGMPRSWLRKKRPPAEPDQVIRQETVPRQDFERWLERVREQQRETEPA